ncbi:thiol:disulfide interchange protein DsbA/DsbL [Thalassotalea euphylliae]|uniref:Thiol:disulfide interchange protein n=1 Tax=Thalassotalea euphylliae TaxID=1655234 RepID=A0A3E0UJJ4_9GAMM|nr:thiol:disulfide interchange protein DsbA/DsbL [Thalassotalea euphylliae]REL37079.1 thiol:disulfide interchange protein DsbA/DsbL [Thalassotalea euphylliae]
MKKIFASLLMVMLLPFAAQAANYQEGNQYTKVSDQLSKKPEVREYFSFYCPHCLRFEPFFANVKKNLPEGVSFERNHVDFLRFTTPEIQFMVTKALATAQQLKVEDKIAAAIFNYIQVQRGAITEEKDIRNIFVLNGVDGAAFDKAFKSFSVNSKAKLMKKMQNDLVKKRALTGVPTVVVNGKYRINADKLDRNNFEQDYINIVKYLSTLEG